VRVTLIVECFEPRGGGVEDVVWTIAHGLAEAGDRVRVLARRGESAAGVDLERLSVPSFWQPLRVGLFARATQRRVAALRAAAETDVVHSFCRTPSQDVFHAGGGSHADYMRSTYGAVGSALRHVSPRHALQLALERRLFSDPRLIVQCPSEMVAREISTRFRVAAPRLRVIRNGVDVGRFGRVPDADAARVREELGGGAAPAWLLAGSGWRRKGLDTALRAVARCRNTATILWVAGADDPAPWRRLARRLGLGSRVRFLGLRRDIERVMVAADGLLLPTRYDAFGGVCLEAAAAGRPVVTSGRAGAAEVLRDAGEVVADPEDAAGFARALDRLEDASLRRDCGEAGRAAAAGLAWPSQIEALRSLYREVAA